jgi:hypothetical protein
MSNLPYAIEGEARLGNIKPNIKPGLRVAICDLTARSNAMCATL